MPNVRLLTLNLHCLVEENLEKKQRKIAQYINDKQIDIICLQEVAQTETLPYIVPPIKQDNYAYTLQTLLRDMNNEYNLEYIPIKHAFNKYDEGLAILSKYPLTIVGTPLLSTIDEYHNWKRRMALICYIPDLNIHVTTTHFGWTDELERWEDQLDRLQEHLPLDTLHILAGDFNITPSSNEYPRLLHHGWNDVLHGSTHETSPTHIDDMDIHLKTSKIDYIMTNQTVDVVESDIVFTKNRVSDHYGVFVELKL